MKNIVIVGAGRVGQAFYHIINSSPLRDELHLTLLDSDEELVSSLERVGARMAAGRDQLEAVLRELKPDAVVCCTPFYINVQVAEIAARLGAHYLDFTEDNAVTRSIEALGISRLTFVPQTGLAPGLVSYIGHSLVTSLGKPRSLDLRVGALPLVSFSPEHYAITWSPSGLINQYLKPAYRLVNGEIEEVAPLTDEEHIIVNGARYEGFTTAGGVGNLAAYSHIPNVEYKTLRHPGHLEFIQKFFTAAEWDADKAVQAAMATFSVTRNDVVVLVAHATDATGRSASAGLHFYPHEGLGLTALELTTSGTGVAVLELILKGALEPGTLLSSQIPYALLKETYGGKLVLSTTR
jgi:saccharopine dehydrogenase-like NADP-dependent oxidoreductase